MPGSIIYTSFHCSFDMIPKISLSWQRRTIVWTRKSIIIPAQWTEQSTWSSAGEGVIYQNTAKWSQTGVFSETTISDTGNWQHSTTHICCSSTWKAATARFTITSPSQETTEMSWLVSMTDVNPPPWLPDVWRCNVMCYRFSLSSYMNYIYYVKIMGRGDSPCHYVAIEFHEVFFELS